MNELEQGKQKIIAFTEEQLRQKGVQFDSVKFMSQRSQSDTDPSNSTLEVVIGSRRVQSDPLRADDIRDCQAVVESTRVLQAISKLLLRLSVGR